MIQLHPPCSGLPLACILLLTLVEVAALCRPRLQVGSIRVLLVVACVVATAMAFLTGYQASAGVANLNEKQQELLALHHTLGKFLLFNAMFLATWCFVIAVAKERLQVWRCFYFVALIIHLTTTGWVGFFGGELVFRHGVGVETKAD